MKTYIVHVVYGSRDDLAGLIARLAETETSFSFSGEYVYGPSSFDSFIHEHCPELEGKLRPCVERWADNCLGYQYEDSSHSFHINPDKPGEEIRVSTAPLYAKRLADLLKEFRKEYRWIQPEEKDSSGSHLPVLHLKSAGNDAHGRPCYVDRKGNAYVDLDYQKHPRTNLATKYPARDVYYGEPDLPITGRECGSPKDLYKTIFVDEFPEPES